MSKEQELRIRNAGRMLSAEDFSGTIRSFFPYWDAQYRPFLLLAVDALPAERFDFKPRPELLTAQQIVVHIAEAERAWNHIAQGRPLEEIEEWVAPNEDPATGNHTVIDAPDHAALHRLLETEHQPTQRWLDRPVADLGQVITYRPPGSGDERRNTIHWLLQRLQEHEIHHRAQLVTYLRLMGVTPPDTM